MRQVRAPRRRRTPFFIESGEPWHTTAIVTADNVLLPTAWLFTRGESSVHIEVLEHPEGLRLVVSGPGLAVASFEFPDRDSVLAFARDKEQELIAQGFQLQAVAERRSGGDGGGRGSDRRRSR